MPLSGRLVLGTFASCSCKPGAACVHLRIDVPPSPETPFSNGAAAAMYQGPENDFKNQHDGACELSAQDSPMAVQAPMVLFEKRDFDEIRALVHRHILVAGHVVHSLVRCLRCRAMSRRRSDPSPHFQGVQRILPRVAGFCACRWHRANGGAGVCAAVVYAVGVQSAYVYVPIILPASKLDTILQNSLRTGY